MHDAEDCQMLVPAFFSAADQEIGDHLVLGLARFRARREASKAIDKQNGRIWVLFLGFSDDSIKTGGSGYPWECLRVDSQTLQFALNSSVAAFNRSVTEWQWVDFM